MRGIYPLPGCAARRNFSTSALLPRNSRRSLEMCPFPRPPPHVVVRGIYLGFPVTEGLPRGVENGNSCPSTSVPFPVMKFKISKDVFLEGLQKVQHVVSSRTTLPILSNVLLGRKGRAPGFHHHGSRRRASPDRSRHPIDKEGATTLPAKRLASIVKELPVQRGRGHGGCEKLRHDQERPVHLQDHRTQRFRVSAASRFRRREDLQDPAGGSEERPQEDRVRDLHGRDPLRAQRHLRFLPRGQARPRRHRRTPPRDGGHGPGVSGIP